MKNFILSLPHYEQKSGVAPQLYTPFVLRTLVDSELRSQRNQTFDGPALFYALLYPERKISLAPMGARRSRGSREGKRRTHFLLHLARNDKERASSIDEQRIDGALGIALFSLLSYQRIPIFLFEISSFVPNRLQKQILFHKILYQLYILLAFVPKTSPVLWDLDYVDKKWWMGLWHSTRRQCGRMPPKRREHCFALLDVSNPVWQASFLPKNSNMWSQNAIQLSCCVQ